MGDISTASQVYLTPHTLRLPSQTKKKLGSESMGKPKDEITEVELSYEVIRIIDKLRQFTVDDIVQFLQKRFSQKGIKLVHTDDGSTELTCDTSYIERAVKTCLRLLCLHGLVGGNVEAEMES